MLDVLVTMPERQDRTTPDHAILYSRITFEKSVVDLNIAYL